MYIRKYFKFFMLFLLPIGVALFSFQNCSQLSSTAGDQYSESLSMQSLLQQKAMTVMTSRCLNCHNANTPSGGVIVSDISNLLSSGAVVPGEPSLSPLYQSIQSGRMPINSRMTQSEVEAIYNWIAEGINKDTSVNPPPASNVLEAKYSSIFKNILQPRCLSCHNSSNAAGGISLSTYNSTINIVNKGNAGTSALYTSVATRKTMPKGGVLLSSKETQAIMDWINAGAANN